MPSIIELPDDEPPAPVPKKMTGQDEATSLKEEGNAHFKKGELPEALAAYSRALKLQPTDPKLKATLHNNRAAVHLKLVDYPAAEKDATKALEFSPNDAKALFRRAQARKELGNAGEAFKDAKLALHYDRNNKAIMKCLEGLVVMNQRKQTEALTTENRVKQMLQFAFTKNDDSEKRVTALNNMVVLTREPVGAALIWASGAVEKLVAMIAHEKDEDLILAAQRVLDELARDEIKCMEMLKHIGIKNVVRMMNHPSDLNLIQSSSLLVQRCFNALSGMDRHKDQKPNKDLCEKNKMTLVRLIIELEDMLTDPEVSALSREAAIDMLLRNMCHMDGGLPRGWSWRFTEDRGLEKLLEVSANIPEQCAFPVTENTREHLAIALTRLYEDMVFDPQRLIYKNCVEKFIFEKLERTKNTAVRVEICACITTLLIGPFDVGFNLIGNTNITEMMLTMATTDDLVQQKVAAELIVNTASKRERASVIVAQGIPILKHLYESEHDSIKARALVGLCKVASSGGTDVSRKALAEGSTLKLAQSCKKLILSPKKDVDMKKWAAEGLSYLTLDADVKEWVVEDNTIIRALISLAKECGPLCVFGVASLFVNLTNTYDEPKVDEEMIRLAKFAKHHVPECHEKDKKEFVEKRIELLVKEGATSACVAISNTESHQCRELLARALHQFVDKKEHRGIVVQEGGAKLLLQLSKEGSEEGKTRAAQGLARIGVTMDPAFAFPGQRMYEVVRPLMDLLHVEKSGLQNYEALLALTNLSSISDSVRKRILKEKSVFNKIEEYWYMQDHSDLRAAAAELILNLMHSENGAKIIIEGENDRLKLMTLYCAEEDEVRLVNASTASLAIVTQDPKACIRIPNEVKSWLDVFKEMCMNPIPESQYRALICVCNMMESDHDVCAKMMQSDIFEVLMALSKIKDPARKRATDMAQRALAAAEKYDLIKATDRELHERKNKVSTIPEEELKPPPGSKPVKVDIRP